MVKSHASVGIVLYHAAQDALLVVRQFRPAVRPPDSSILLTDSRMCSLPAAGGTQTMKRCQVV